MRNIKFIVLSTLLFTCGVFTSCNKTSYDVMVVGVDHKTFKETDDLIAALTNKSELVIDNLNFYTGNIGSKKIVIAESPFGMSKAAMATTIGIKHFSPKTVISEGSAGGHHDNIHPLDIVLGKDILDMSSYHGDMERDPEDWENLQNPTLHSDEELLKKAREVENKFGRKFIESNGTISSSNAWNTGVEYVKKLHIAFGEDCEEMESYAVVDVCNHYKIPSLAIKMISNNLITDDEDDWKACSYVQKYTIDVIKAI